MILNSRADSAMPTRPIIRLLRAAETRPGPGIRGEIREAEYVFKLYYNYAASDGSPIKN